MQKEAELQEIVRLVGPDALPPSDQAILEGARMIREDFLRQNAFHDVDTYCPPKKQYEMLRIMLEYYELAKKAVSKGISIDAIKGLKCREEIARMATTPNEAFEEVFKRIEESMLAEFKGMGGSI